MPLWIIYHPPSAFIDTSSKKSLSEDITRLYTSIGLPAFYVVVNFIKMEDGDTWVGGELKTEKAFIRIVIEHIAVTLPDSDDAYMRTTAAIDKLLAPHVADKGYDWEYHVDETERRLWKINGIVAPPHPSEGEKLWFKENRASEWKSRVEKD